MYLCCFCFAACKLVLKAILEELSKSGIIRITHGQNLSHYLGIFICIWDSQVVLVIKNLPVNWRNKSCGFGPWVGKIPWRRAGQLTPVVLRGDSRGQKSLAGYSP